MSEDRAVLLYGSHARGDADAISDVDVLIVDATVCTGQEISALLPKACSGPIHMSQYAWTELEAMRNYGSLFLHHIASEAVPIEYKGKGHERLLTLLASLGPYRLGLRDLASFRATLHDSRVGLRMGVQPCFELAVIGGVARHASVLACYVAGSPTFGRKSIVHAAVLLGMDWAVEQLTKAHRFRLFEAGQCQFPGQVSRIDVESDIDVVSELLDRLEVRLHANAA